MKWSGKPILRVTAAIAVLVTLALAASCTGFFQNPTWTTITIQPPAPAVAVGFSEPLTAWGTDTNGQRSQITHNLVWTLSGASNGGTVATLDPNSGVLKGVAAGTVTVTASSEGISGTATATVADEVSTMTITPATASVQDNGTNYRSFTITSGSTNITSLVTLTAYLNGQTVTGLPCGYQLGNSTDGTQDCQPATSLLTPGTTQIYSIVVTYAGYTGTSQVSATLTVSE